MKTKNFSVAIRRSQRAWKSRKRQMEARTASICCRCGHAVARPCRSNEAAAACAHWAFAKWSLKSKKDRMSTDNVSRETTEQESTAR